MSKNTELDVIPLRGFGWHKTALYTAHAFVWIGFWISLYGAWIKSDISALAYSLMLLGIGLLLFRGVAFFINVWVMWAAYISTVRPGKRRGNLFQTRPLPISGD